MNSSEFQSVHEAFERFENEVVRVPKAENDEAKRVHPKIRGTLERELPEHLETFLSGSYGRRVQAVRLKDIDIIVVLDDPDGRFAASAGGRPRGHPQGGPRIGAREGHGEAEALRASHPPRP